MKKQRVSPTEGEPEELKTLVSKGRAAVYKQTHVRIRLLSDGNQADGPMMGQEIIRALKLGHCQGGTGAPRCRERRRP